jgi:integrase
MNEPIYQALQRVIARKTDDSPFVFVNPKGRPLDTRYVSINLWNPTLEKAGLSYRRPYETRHTAAVLHIAAHENPMYVSNMLGHSNTKMLFDIYAPYVVNAARNDGSAFLTMMMQRGIS